MNGLELKWTVRVGETERLKNKKKLELNTIGLSTVIQEFWTWTVHLSSKDRTLWLKLPLTLIQDRPL